MSKRSRISAILIAFLLFFSATTAFAGEAMPAKEAVKNVVTIDVGDNAKQLLGEGGEKIYTALVVLAKSMNTTVEKVFPFYVKQAKTYATANIKICAWFIGVCIGLSIIFGALCILCNKLDYDGYGTTFFAFSMISLAFAIVALGIGGIYLSEWITAIKNPEYKATQQIIADAAKLITAGK